MTDRSALGRRELNKLQTRERLIEAACELMARSGETATVEEIADRAQVSRATFFNYFPSKDELLHAIHHTQMAVLEELVTELLVTELTTAERIAALFADLARLASQQPRFLFTYIRQLDRLATTEQMTERFGALAEQIARLLEAGVALGEVRTDVSTTFLSEMVGSVYLSSLRYGRPEVDVTAFARYFADAGVFAAGTTLPQVGRPGR